VCVCVCVCVCARACVRVCVRECVFGSAVALANPATIEFEVCDRGKMRVSDCDTRDQVCRTSLLPGMLKTLHFNNDTKKPIKLFEVRFLVSLVD
jgi:hypothetical protein